MVDVLVREITPRKIIMRHTILSVLRVFKTKELPKYISTEKQNIL